MPDPQISADDLITAAQRAALTANELIYEVRLIVDHLEMQRPKPKRKLKALSLVILHLEAEVSAYNALGTGMG